MTFGIEVTGLDEAQRQLDEMIKNLGDDAIGQWFERAVKTTNEVCNDAKVTWVRGTKKGDIGNINVSDKKSAECLLKALDKIIQQAPEPAKSMLTQYKADLKKRFNIT